MPNIASPPGGAAGSGVPEQPYPVVSRNDLLNLTRASEVSLVPKPGCGDHVLARFSNGSHACYGAMSQVTESPGDVTIEIFTGVLPEAEGRPCPAVAELQEMEIQLSGPLGNRRLR